MKKSINYFTVLFISLIIISCGGSSDDSTPPDPTNPNPNPTSSRFTKKVLIEDFTGTWCGWCPRVSYGIEKVEEQTENVAIVAIHRGNDPYNFTESNIGSLDDGSYPTAKLDRKTLWGYPEPNNISQVLTINSNVALLGLSIDSQLSGGNIDLTVKTTFEVNLSETKLVVYITEDKLIYDQNNYTDYYNGVDVISNFEHNNVLRKVLTNIQGDGIPSSESKKDNEYTQSFNIAVPANISNSTNLNIVAFVVDSSGKTLNAQKASINTFQDYD